MTALEQYLIDENKDMQKRLAEAYRELGFIEGKLMCIYQRYPRLCMGIIRGGKYEEGGCYEKKNEYLRIAR